MQSKEQIGTRQMAILVIYFIIGDMLLFLPSNLSNTAHQDAWISALIGLAIGVAIAWYVYWYSQRFPGLTLVEIHNLVLGRWFGGGVTLVYVVIFFNNSIVQIREIGDFVSTQMMTETPMRVICLLFTFLYIIALRSGLENIARFAETFFPMFALMLALLMVSSLPESHLANLTPVLENGFKPLAEGVLFYISFPFCEMFVFWMIFPNVNQNKHFRRDYVIAALIGGATIFSVLMISLLVLGPYLTSHQMYSTYTLAKKISIGHFIERIEAILAITWILSTFMRSIIYGYAFIRGIEQMFHLKDYRTLTVPLGVVAFGYAMLIYPNIVFFNSVNPYWISMDLTVIPFLSLTVYIIYVIKSRFQQNTPRQ
ncbi:endospore germination permease [Paenibacillus sp. SYP-B3998]|uniref:Endospore germination permease n=1 Tax=Paenibacillus sp. SYP-B3998 TaxID=2678564 RepID=A0A6G4A2B8_9BACL|nr:endospore germination permease [Paenibacillus sp. SYP-B3998]NEW08532.1 endospore germination permease [Paenibacillus sp. SYP-B3998]